VGDVGTAVCICGKTVMERKNADFAMSVVAGGIIWYFGRIRRAILWSSFTPEFRMMNDERDEKKI
jgi:hypothetical protein